MQQRIIWDILLKIRKTVKNEEKFKFIQIIFYILLTLLAMYLLISAILNSMYSI